MGTLYVVGTPIGNLEDISPRALGVLRRVSLVASENPARTRRLLARYDIPTPLRRYTDAYDRKKQKRLAALLEALAEGDVALVSEAGMPGLADPGYELIAAALARGVPVAPVPGPTALNAALSVAGLPIERFIFVGFLPRTATARRELLASLVERPLALVAYEAPHRLLNTLADLADLFGGRPMVAAGELTKLYEEVRRGTAAELLAHYRQHKPRGEFTLVISPPPSPPRGTGGEFEARPRGAGGGSEPPPRGTGGGSEPPPRGAGGGSEPPPRGAGGGSEPPPRGTGGGSELPPCSQGEDPNFPPALRGGQRGGKL